MLVEKYAVYVTEGEMLIKSNTDTLASNHHTNTCQSLMMLDTHLIIPFDSGQLNEINCVLIKLTKGRLLPL